MNLYVKKEGPLYFRQPDTCPQTDPRKGFFRTRVVGFSSLRPRPLCKSVTRYGRTVRCYKCEDVNSTSQELVDLDDG